MNSRYLTALGLAVLICGAARAQAQDAETPLADAQAPVAARADVAPDPANDEHIYRRIINAMAGMSDEEKARFLNNNPRVLEFLKEKHPNIIARLRNALSDDGRERHVRREHERERVQRRIERRETRREAAPVRPQPVRR